MLAWVTPDDPPGEDICIRVYCPSGVDYEAALRGAILSLTEVINWEQVGTQTPETVSDAFFDAYQKTLEWGRCMPVGTVYFFAGDDAPEGSLLCDGSSYATDDYPLLFDAIGYTWGGSGANFSVPDMRERFALGSGVGVDVGDEGGEQNHTLTGSEMPNHDHDIPIIALTGGGLEPIPVYVPTPIFGIQTSAEGGGNSHNNMPPYRGLLSCIVSR